MIPFPKSTSTISPEKKPTNIPSVRPFIKPKAEVSIIRRFGAMPPRDMNLNRVHCSKKQTNTSTNSILFLINLFSPP